MAMQFSSWISERWRLGRRFRIVVIAAFVIFLATFLYPFQTTTVPQWDLRVIDDAGAPVREINVTEHWQDYQLEADGHEEAQSTDQDGRASFGIRQIRANLIRRLMARISRLWSNTRGRPVHYGAVVVWGKKEYETTVAVYQGEAPTPELRVRRLR